MIKRKIDDMKAMKIFFILLYTIAPLVILPYFAYREENGYILFGIVFAYLAVIIAAYKSPLFYIITLFCIAFWIIRGFNIHQYITLFLFCMLTDFLFFKCADYFEILYDEQINPKKYQELAEIDKRIKADLLKYKLEHPAEKITRKIIEAIKDNIFLSDELQKIKNQLQ